MKPIDYKKGDSVSIYPIAGKFWGLVVKKEGEDYYVQVTKDRIIKMHKKYIRGKIND